MTLQELVSQALDGVDEMSPYRLAAVVSALSGKKVVPQLTYSYVRQGFIKASRNSLGHWTISQEDAAAWLVKYLTRHGSVLD